MNLLKTTPAYLWINARGQEILDLIIWSFLFLEKNRRASDNGFSNRNFSRYSGSSKCIFIFSNISRPPPSSGYFLVSRIHAPFKPPFEDLQVTDWFDDCSNLICQGAIDYKH